MLLSDERVADGSYLEPLASKKSLMIILCLGTDSLLMPADPGPHPGAI
ncbi:MAG TPA: hypothetical protein VE954_02300 [Oligoflexus sp.]|nr:hypothetical protein [Oligoflexus sp.]